MTAHAKWRIGTSAVGLALFLFAAVWLMVGWGTAALLPLMVASAGQTYFLMGAVARDNDKEARP